MATRVVEGKKPYTGGEAIDIDQNKVISLKLRDENNLIIYDSGDDEIYVDLQLEDGIEPTDAFPVGVNTGRVLVADGWDKTGTLICAKTTSGDEIKLLYADDGTLYMDNGTGTFKQIYFKGDVDAIVQAIYDYIDTNANTKTFKLSSLSDLATAQEAYDWWKNGGYPILDLGNLHLLNLQTISSGTGLLIFTQPFIIDEYSSHSTTELYQNSKILEVVDDVVVGITSQADTIGNYLDTNYNYSTPYIPTYDGSPATKKYVDGKITTSSTAPSNPTEGMLWYDTTNDVLKVYDGSQWNSTGGGSDIEYVTQAEYNALLPGALTDNKHYFIYSTSGGGGRQPGVNTIAYFPLESDAVDIVNNITLTSHSTTNYTTEGGVTSANFTRINCLYNTSVNLLPQGDISKTVSLWAYITDGFVGWAGIVMFGADSTGAAFGLSGYSNSNNIILTRGGSVSPTYTPAQNIWTNYIFTYSPQNKRVLYANGVPVITWSETAPTTGTNLYIGANIGSESAGLGYKGNLSNVILEDKERTAQEVSDYYNLTKSNYGL